MALSVEITPNHSDLEDENGELLTFGVDDWTDGVWERKVQANPSGAEDEIVVRVTSDVPNEDGTTDTVYGRITLDREVMGVWDSGAVTGKVGEDIEVGWRVTDSNGEELPRCPSGLVSVSYDFTRADGEPEADGDVTIEWYEQGTYDRGAGTVRVMSPGTLRLSLLTTGSDDDYCVVEVSGIEHPSLANLCEAIKERYEYIKQSELSLDETSPLSTIRARAVDSVQGYLKSYDLETNTVVEYGSSDASSMFPSVPTSEDEIDAWISTCYKEIVKVRRKRSSYITTMRKKSGAGYGSRAYEWDDEKEEYYWTSSISSAKKKAEDYMNENIYEGSGSEIVCYKFGEYVDISPGDYWPNHCTCSYRCTKFSVSCAGKVNFNPGGTARFVVHSEKYNTFRKFGCGIPDEGKNGYMFGSISFSENQNEISSGWSYDYFSTNIPWDTIDPDVGSGDSTSGGGFKLTMKEAIINIGFKH